MNLERGVYLVTQADRSAGRSTPEVVAAAVEAGADAVQLREKNATARERYELGRELRGITAEAGVPLIVNDRVDLALALDADGVHVGDDDLPIAAARELLGEGATIGRSVSTVAGAERAEAAGADYLGVGAVFATGTKAVSGESAEIGVERVCEIAASASIPTVGIGGIDAENAAAVSAAGADGVAVVSAVTDADDPAAATRGLAAAVKEGRA